MCAACSATTANRVIGFETTDSGDGTNLKNGMKGALEDRHLFIQVASSDFFREGRRLQALYPDAHVEGHWDASSETALLLLYPDGCGDW